MADKKKKSDAFKGGAPPPAITVDKHPIGVSSEYNPPTGKAIYFPGAENELVGGMSGEDRADLQIRLKSLGLIAPKARIVLGSWDNPSANALRQVLTYANSRGLLWYQALAEMEGAAAANPVAGTVQTRAATNPLDFQALAEDSGHSELGRNLTAGEAQQVAGSLAGAEAPYLAGDNPTSPPGSAAFQDIAKQRVRALDPTRASSRDVVKVASVIQQMLAGRMPSESQQLPEGA